MIKDEMLVSEVSRKALRLLDQPVPRQAKGTPYERPETTFFQDATEPSPDSVTIFIYSDLRYGSFFGDSDHWERSEACVLRAESFYGLLARLEAGKDVSMELPATIIETDIAWGADCVDPHETITHKEEAVLLHIGISADLNTVNLKLLRQESKGFIPYAQIQRN